MFVWHLEVDQILRLVSQPPGQLMDDLLEDHRVDVLAKHVEQEPVTHLGLLDDDIDALLLDEPEPYEQEVGAHPRRDDDHQPVQHNQGSEEREHKEVEPQEDVDLLIDNVDGQDTECIVTLDVARGTELVEGALGHAGKDVDDRVHPILFITHGKGYNLDTKGEEGPTEESVHQKQLAYNHGAKRKQGYHLVRTC